jgi:hypothetical protein
MYAAEKAQELQEQAEQAPKSEPWLKKIEAALKRERTWREDAKATIERYRLDGLDDEDPAKYNILWSNTEVLRQSIYNQPPVPDVRQRWETKDPVALAVAELLDRGLTYCIEASGFDLVGKRAVLDFLLPGRAVVRLWYDPKIVETPPALMPDGTVLPPGKRLVDENLVFENVAWNDFLHSDACYWGDVDWIAFRHRMSKEDAEKNFPERYKELSYKKTGEEDERGRDWDESPAGAHEGEDDSASRAVVWGIWDKREKAVVWVSRGVDAVLTKTKPPLDLKDFFPVPRPLLAIDVPASLIPEPLYKQYKKQAEELDVLSQRIKRLTAAIKYRALYDSSVGDDLQNLFSNAVDGDMVPTQNALAYLEKGGLGNAIFSMPLGEAAAVLDKLYQAREMAKQVIYEITGISDVLRGATNPNETATAQQLKATWGSSRVDGMKREIQRFFRDCLEIASEILAEHFQPETWEKMTSLDYPTREEREKAVQLLGMAAQAQGIVSQAQKQGLPPPAMAVQQLKAIGDLSAEKEAAEKPSWDQIDAILKSDKMRSFKIDIETDSTIAPNQQAEMKDLAETMQMIGALIGQIVPGMKEGIIPQELGLSLVSSVVRKTPLANEMTALLDKYQGQFEEGNPLEGELKRMAEENKALKQQLESKQGELALKGQELQQKAQSDAAGHRIDMTEAQLKAADLAARRQEQERRLYVQGG